MESQKSYKMQTAIQKSENIRYITMLTIIAFLFILFFSSQGLFSLTRNEYFHKLRNSISGGGMTMIILTGGIDLSVGAVIALSGEQVL